VVTTLKGQTTQGTGLEQATGVGLLACI